MTVLRTFLKLSIAILENRGNGIKLRSKCKPESNAGFVRTGVEKKKLQFCPAAEWSLQGTLDVPRGLLCLN